MANKLLYIVSLVALVSSCKPSMTPLEYSNKLARISDTMYSKGRNWTTALMNLRPQKRYADLKPLRLDLEEFITRKITDLEKDPDVKGSATLKNAMLQFMDFEKEYAHGSLSAFEQMNASTGDAEEQVAVNKLIEASSLEKVYLEKLQKAQYDYAQKNNFIIQVGQAAQ